MATETQAGAPAELTTRDYYEEWQRREGAPSVTGFYIDDLKTLELGVWERKGGKGAFLNLEGTGGVNDAHIVEIAPGGSSQPERHMYEEMVYVLAGRGSTSVWYDEDKKQTFEWGTGSLFSIPLNAWYQHHNGSGLEPTRYMAVTNAPTMLRMMHNEDFLFNNPFRFEDRFSSEQGYFNGEGKLFKQRNTHAWESNFIPNVHTLELHSWAERGGGGSNIMIEMAHNSMGAHISQFQIGTYKKGHRHGPGAHVVILDGDGFSLLWREGDEDYKKCDWRPGAVIVPPDNWFHQHFNTGTTPARYLALRYGGRRYRQPSSIGRGEVDVSTKAGGNQIEYQDEDPRIIEMFEAECAKHGATPRMREMLGKS
ncbi:MAG: cupin domain-containing protein [Chloroflexota bacterium]